MAEVKTIDSNTLRDWLELGQPVSILDIRSLSERAEWQIPTSIHFDVYDKLKQNDFEALNGLHLDKSIPVVTFCAGGKLSLVAAKLLTTQGYDAYSLDGGMKGWTLAWNTATITFPDFEIIQFRRTGKGCLSYMIIANHEAIVVDASLDINVYQKYLLARKAVLKYALETHIHADHISRTKQLAEKNNAPLFLPIPNKVIFNFESIIDTTIFELGNIKIKVIKTPGHTLESTTFLIDDKVLLTGDTLFIDGVGRPDLKANNDEAFQKTKKLYQSLQILLALDENIVVLPSHTSKPVDFDSKPIKTTIGIVKNNVAILQLDELDFTNTIMQRIPPTPTNYLSILELNRIGDFGEASPIDLEAGSNICAIS